MEQTSQILARKELISSKIQLKIILKFKPKWAKYLTNQRLQASRMVCLVIATMTLMEPTLTLERMKLIVSYHSFKWCKTVKASKLMADGLVLRLIVKKSKKSRVYLQNDQSSKKRKSIQETPSKRSRNPTLSWLKRQRHCYKKSNSARLQAQT